MKLYDNKGRKFRKLKRYAEREINVSRSDEEQRIKVRTKARELGITQKDVNERARKIKRTWI